MDFLPLIGLAALVDDVGAKNLHRLIAATGGAEAAWGADRATLERAGVSQRAAERFLEIRASVDVNAIAATVEHERITVIPWGDLQYPTLLTQIPDPPICLFVRGNVAALHTRSLAVVGTRNATLAGRSAAEVLVAPLARAGLTITSGLAYGIDATAHAATLRASGCTVAVLGTGIDEASIYPPAHRRLAQSIVDAGGCLVTEFVPGTPGLPLHFPARNRIIAGLTVGTLVVEAPEASGALITARFALDFGREVFAVPGAITNPVSAGCNALLKSGACLVTSASDIIDALHLEELLPPAPKRAMPAGGLAGRVFDVLSAAPKHIDDLQNELGIATSELAHTLTSLELDGAVRDIGGGRYIRSA
jgi:DNA processing protein